MVARCETKGGLVEDVASVYEWVDRKIAGSRASAGRCKACGKCCDFARFDHRLYVTTPEVMYLASLLGPAALRPMKTLICPYNADGICAIYEHRFAGCRIFCCTGDPALQSELGEFALTKFKAICDKYRIAYRYTDLPTALSTSAGF